jgi:hypothetical protein
MKVMKKMKIMNFFRFGFALFMSFMSKALVDR